MRSPVRLVVLDDHQLFAETLVLALVRSGHDTRRVAVPTRAGSPDALVRKVVALRPSIALVDLDLGPFGSGLRLVRPLVAADIAVLVVTSTPRSHWGESLVHGASRVFAKTTGLDAILATVHDLSTGHQLPTRAEYDELVSEWEASLGTADATRDLIAELSVREQEVLAQLMDGRVAKEIARDWVVSEATVRTQIRAILHKLGVSSQLAAVVLATQSGWRLNQD